MDPHRLAQKFFRIIFHFERTVLVESSGSSEALAALYSEGLYFLYGMLFREMFRVNTQGIIPEPPTADRV